MMKLKCFRKINTFRAQAYLAATEDYEEIERTQTFAGNQLRMVDAKKL